tara:strand:- start:40 stop:393 length:354 start_codon:yes stop_codon:yes gene_type:complete
MATPCGSFPVVPRRVEVLSGVIFDTFLSRALTVYTLPAGNVYTVNALDKNVSKITPDSTSTLLGTTGKDPQGVAIDSDGNVYTANFSSDDVSKKLVSGLHHVLAHSNFTADQHVVTG